MIAIVNITLVSFYVVIICMTRAVRHSLVLVLDTVPFGRETQGRNASSEFACVGKWSWSEKAAKISNWYYVKYRCRRKVLVDIEFKIALPFPPPFNQRMASTKFIKVKTIKCLKVEVALAGDI